MRVFFLTLILISTVCAVSSAQANKSEPCPEINVSSLTTDVSSGRTVIFTVTIATESEKFPIGLKWLVEGGEIIEGQGTRSIKTRQEDVGNNLVATVEAKFLPDGCKVTHTETAATWCPLPIREIDEFLISANQIDKVKLNNLVSRFRNGSSEQIYIIEQFENRTPQKIIKQKNQKTIDYLRSQGIERASIILLNGTGKENLTQFFLVPSGATPPYCEDCRTIEMK